ncbi:MAG: aminoacyl-tRNA hydrolase [Alphaproteobacteria bacterium]|nr:aminoacyl-tRNA hydrolase [Alphaproteobacteria bacterium]
MYLVVGLGNPGAQYAGTRHNVGFLVVDVLARRAMTDLGKSQSGALADKVRLADQAVVLAKPQQYMNLSGGPTQALAAFYKVDTDHIVVVHDDLDLPFGDVRVKSGGGHGGHNGLRDLHSRLGSPSYQRVRVGISRPPKGWDTADYVLGRWTSDESASLGEVVDTAADAVEHVLRRGVSDAMNLYNQRRSGDAGQDLVS